MLCCVFENDNSRLIVSVIDRDELNNSNHKYKPDTASTAIATATAASAAKLRR